MRGCEDTPKGKVITSSVRGSLSNSWRARATRSRDGSSVDVAVSPSPLWLDLGASAAERAAFTPTALSVTGRATLERAWEVTCSIPSALMLSCESDSAERRVALHAVSVSPSATLLPERGSDAGEESECSLRLPVAGAIASLGVGAGMV